MVLFFELSVTDDKNCSSKDTINVTVKRTIIPGDLDDNESVDLDGAILALKILTGQNVINYSDEKLSLKDIIFIMQTKSFRF